jgi:hypothetical protein
MNAPPIVECHVHFQRRGKGRKELQVGQERRPAALPGRVPRVVRLLALAHRFEKLLRDGFVTNYGHLAELGHVSRARICQIMNLLLLAPDIQEQVLLLPRTVSGTDPIHFRRLEAIAMQPDWRKQRRMWQDLLRSGS